MKKNAPLDPVDEQVKSTMLDAVKGGKSITEATKAGMQAAKPKRPKMGPSVGKAQPGPKNAKGKEAPKFAESPMIDKSTGERSTDDI
jgi:hypothetical protein